MCTYQDIIQSFDIIEHLDNILDSQILNNLINTINSTDFIKYLNKFETKSSSDLNILIATLNSCDSNTQQLIYKKFKLEFSS